MKKFTDQFHFSLNAFCTPFMLFFSLITADFIKTCQIYNVSEPEFVKCSTESIQALFDNINKGKLNVRVKNDERVSWNYFPSQEFLAWRMCKWIHCVLTESVFLLEMGQSVSMRPCPKLSSQDSGIRMSCVVSKKFVKEGFYLCWC